MIIQLQGLDPIRLPDSYEGLTLGQLKRIIDTELTPIGLIHAITGVDLTPYNIEQISEVANYVALMLRPYEITNPYKGKPLERRKFVEVYAFELACRKEYKNKALQYIELLRIFVDGPESYILADAVPMLNSYLKEIADMNKAWSEKMPDKSTVKERQAGLKNFEQFDRWGTAYRLAGKDLTKIKDIWDMPYTEVFQACYYNYVEAEFQRKLTISQSK